MPFNDTQWHQMRLNTTQCRSTLICSWFFHLRSQVLNKIEFGAFTKPVWEKIDATICVLSLSRFYLISHRAIEPSSIGKVLFSCDSYSELIMKKSNFREKRLFVASPDQFQEILQLTAHKEWFCWKIVYNFNYFFTSKIDWAIPFLWRK